MMAKSHVVVGLAGWIAAAPVLHLPTLAPTYIGLVVVGALLPDIDHPKSWIGRRARPISTTIAATLGHRGITHSAAAVVVGTALLVWLGHRRGAVSALAVGYLSHLAADMLTPQGLPLTWPFRRNWGFPLCRTGSITEPVIVAALACAIICWAMTHGIVRFPSYLR